MAKSSAQKKGGKFIATWNGGGPQYSSHYSSPLRHQKGQIEQDRFLTSFIDPKDGARTWSF